MITKKKINKVCIISDNFIPSHISSAGMIYNLANSFTHQKIEVLCIYSGENPYSKSRSKKLKFINYDVSKLDFITSNLISSFRYKSNYHRFFFEITLSITLAFKCLLNFKKIRDIDLIIWYGPSSFLWIVVFTLKIIKKAPVYFILRDIFPDWLINLKVIQNKFLIILLKFLTKPQYSISDIIGVESRENINYLKEKIVHHGKIEFLYNWPNLTSTKITKVEDELRNNFKKHIRKNRNKKIINLLYLGNSSKAHDYFSLIQFLKTERSPSKTPYSINIFGAKNKFNKYENCEIQTFWGVVPEYNLPFILSEVDCGIVSLNRNLTTYNIPGKFVSYAQFELPVICFAKLNSALAKLIIKYDCGIVIDLDQNLEKNIKKLSYFLNNFNKNRHYYSNNSARLFKECFDTKFVVKQILQHFN